MLLLVALAHLYRGVFPFLKIWSLYPAIFGQATPSAFGRFGLALTVYMYLKDRAGKGQDCWPAVKTIASDLDLSRSTIKRALHDLTKAGLVVKEARYRENGSNTSNRFILRK